MKKRVPLILVLSSLFLGSCSQQVLTDNPGFSLPEASRLAIDPGINPDPLPPLVVVDFPDLILTAVNVDNYTSTRITYSYTVKNNGTASISVPSISVQAYISLDATLSSSDSPAGGTTVGFSGSLAPGQSLSGSFSATPGPGVIVPERYIILKVNTANAEISKSNNVRYNQIFLRWVDFKHVTLSGPISGNYIQTAAVIKNNGLQSVLLAGVGEQFYVSSNNTLDSSDIPCGGYSVSAMTGKSELAPGESVTVYFSTSKPGSFNPAVHRFLLAKIDSSQAIFEVDETNNVISYQFP